MDILSDVLTLVRLESVRYFQHDFRGNWGMDVPDSNFASFHLVTRGRCLLYTKKWGEPIPVYGGDVIIFPHGSAHRLVDQPGAICRPVQDIREDIKAGRPVFSEGGESASLICGHYHWRSGFDHPFLKGLPSFLHIKSEQNTRGPSWFQLILSLILDESGADLSGGQFLSKRLEEVVFVQALRAYWGEDKGLGKIMADGAAYQALQLIHGRPEYPWTLELLAQRVGISRTYLANRFREAVGETPMSYLTQWRMLQAKEMLLETDESVAAVADRVGYRSESAFSKAFRRQFEVTPARVRR